MALLTAKKISRLAVALLERQLTLVRTVEMVPGDEYRGSNGDTVTIRVPQPVSSRTQATAGATITYDDITEIPVDVTLEHLYIGKLVSDEELTYTIEDFGRQILRPMTAGVARGAEDELVGVMNALAADASFAATATAADTRAQVLAVREYLTAADCPAEDRYLAVAPDITTRLLSVDEFVKVDESGSDDALRRAVVGRIFGLTVVENNGLTTGTAVGYHKSGFGMANRPPVAPRGASSSETSTVGGVSLRTIFQYVPDKLSDAVVVSTFAGAAAVYEDGTGADGTDNQRFIKLDTGV